MFKSLPGHSHRKESIKKGWQAFRKDKPFHFCFLHIQPRWSTRQVPSNKMWTCRVLQSKELPWEFPASHSAQEAQHTSERYWLSGETLYFTSKWWKYLSERHSLFTKEWQLLAEWFTSLWKESCLPITRRHYLTDGQHPPESYFSTARPKFILYGS